MATEITPPPVDGSLLGYEQKTLEQLISPEEREQLEKEGNKPFTTRAARQLLTALYLTQHFQSKPVCVAEFRKVK